MINVQLYQNQIWKTGIRTQSQILLIEIFNQILQGKKMPRIRILLPRKRTVFQDNAQWQK